MSGYPGYTGNQVGGGSHDVEMGQNPRTSQLQPPGVVAYGGGGQQSYGYGGGYGQPQQSQGGAASYGQAGPQKPYNPYGAQAGGKAQYQQPQYAGYGAQQTGGGYTAPPVQQPPPRPPTSQYIQNMEQSVRHGFIRKVYGIVIVQLLLTFGLVAVFSYIPAVQEYSMNNTWLMGVSAGAVFALMIGIACCPGSVMYKFPGNLILLMILSLFMGVMLGVIGATYACDSQDYDRQTGKWICITNPDGPAVNGRMSVLLAMAITIALVAVLTLFACQTKYDFTGYGPYLVSGVFIFFVFFMIAGLWLRFNDVFNLVYACVGVLLFSGLLVYNTQMIVGGKNRKYSLGPDDYILGALSIYIDIINLFMFILTIIGFSR
eukprot:CAMPEP_0197476962 /NCGR_PEP_ID=MMETSP1309-20131121/12262_1 /TAXON_ID=464262 /ORGANISM="Genus nov. species nov., Strain RCC998" /LENGTH=373 /DNA_ID=CAMNT_0043017621 /DNA_START=101 /DNA_END=1222 /DNA_ORIENTATION=-